MLADTLIFKLAAESFLTIAASSLHWKDLPHRTHDIILRGGSRHVMKGAGSRSSQEQKLRALALVREWLLFTTHTSIFLKTKLALFVLYHLIDTLFLLFFLFYHVLSWS